jgi:hypothetical protein
VQGQGQHADLGRHRRRQDHAAQHPVRLHSAGERIVTIEDAAELQMQQPHVVRLETRPMNIEGKGEITQRALVRNALRMRPDRIIIGEVRGAEAVDMLQAMNTGHDGSLTTIHANNPRDALSRLENMIGMANLNLPHKAARQQIASAITVVIQALRLIDGRRKITSIQEITGMEGEVITMQEIFAFRQTGVGQPTAPSRAISRPPACGPSSANGCARSASPCPTRCSTQPPLPVRRSAMLFHDNQRHWRRSRGAGVHRRRAAARRACT